MNLDAFYMNEEHGGAPSTHIVKVQFSMMKSGVYGQVSQNDARKCCRGSFFQTVQLRNPPYSLCVHTCWVFIPKMLLTSGNPQKNYHTFSQEVIKCHVCFLMDEVL